MPPRPVRLLLGGVITAAILALAFQVSGIGTSSNGPSSPVEGIVTAVDAASLTDVRGFTIRTPTGSSYAFKLGLLENATDFSPSHLAEHQATSSPVLVSFRVENGERVAYRLEDADASPSPPAAT